MPVDPRIALGVVGPQIDDPLTAQAKRMKLSDLAGQQQLQQMQIADAQRQQTETQSLNDLYRTTGGDPTKIREGLASGGLGSRIPAFDKQQAELGKLGTDLDAGKLKVAKERLDLVGGALQSLLAGPAVTHDQVRATLTDLVQQGIIPADRGAAMYSSLPPDPAALRSRLMQIGMQTMDASARLTALTPKIDYKQTGKQMVPVDTNALTNPNPRALTMTTTPDADQSAAASRYATQTAAGTAANRLKFDEKKDTRDQETGKWQYDATRGGLVNMRTGEFKVATQDGQPIAPTKVSAIADAQEAINLINQAEPIMKGATGSIGGAWIDKAAQVFGAATPGSINAQQLKAIEGALIAKMPKMSGPQSDRDVALYKQMAAVIGDETVPYERKSAALEEVRKIQERYAGVPPGSSKPARKASGTVQDAPKPGTVQDGYVYRGGDPSKPESWSKK